MNMKGSKTGWPQLEIQGLFEYPVEKTKSIFSGRVTASQGDVLTIEITSSPGIEIIEDQEIMIKYPEISLVGGFKVIKNTRSPDAVTLQAELSPEFGERERGRPEDYLTNWKDQKVQLIPLVVMKASHKGGIVLTVAPIDPRLAVATIGDDPVADPANPLFWDQNKNYKLDQEEGQKIKENLHTKIGTADGLTVDEVKRLLPGFLVKSAKYRPSFPAYMEQTMLFPRINLRVMPAGEDKIYFDFPAKDFQAEDLPGVLHNNVLPDGERFGKVFLQNTLMDMRQNLLEAGKEQQAREEGEKKVRRQKTEVLAPKKTPLYFSTLIDNHGTMIGRFQIKKVLTLLRGSHIGFRIVVLKKQALLWRAEKQNIHGASLLIGAFTPVTPGPVNAAGL